VVSAFISSRHNVDDKRICIRNKNKSVSFTSVGLFICGGFHPNPPSFIQTQIFCYFLKSFLLSSMKFKNIIDESNYPFWFEKNTDVFEIKVFDLIASNRWKGNLVEWQKVSWYNTIAVVFSTSWWGGSKHIFFLLVWPVWPFFYPNI